MRTVQRRLLQYVSNHWKDIKFRGPKVKFNGGINTEGNYPNLKIWQDNPAKHKIKFAFRISSKSISQNENSEFMPESFPTKDQNDNIRNLEQFAKNPLFSEFLKSAKTSNPTNAITYSVYVKLERMANCYSIWDLM